MKPRSWWPQWLNRTPSKRSRDAFAEEMTRLQKEAGYSEEDPTKSERTLRLYTFLGRVVVCGDLAIHAVLFEAYMCTKLRLTHYLRVDRLKKEGEAVDCVTNGVAKLATEFAAWGIATKRHPDDDGARKYVTKLHKRITAAVKVREAALEKEEWQRATRIGVNSALSAVAEYMTDIHPNGKHIRALYAAADAEIDMEQNVDCLRIVGTFEEPIDLLHRSYSTCAECYSNVQKNKYSD